SLGLILGLRASMSEESFLSWGWRVPFILSILLLAFSLYVRMKLSESPVFLAMKAQGRTAANPIKETFVNPANLKMVLLTIFVAVASSAFISYWVHFYALRFFALILKISSQSAYTYLTLSHLMRTPFFVFPGWRTDKIARKWIMLSGCMLSALFFVTTFQGLA